MTSQNRVLSFAWDPQEHPRIPGHHHGGGEFTKVGKTAAEIAGQSPSHYIHPSTGHVMGKSEVGDTYEELFKAKGARMLEQRFGGHPYIRIAGNEGARNVPLDFRLDSKYGGELKSLNINAKNQRIAMKTPEVIRKVQTAKKNGWNQLIVLQVVDQKTSTVHVYVHEGFQSTRVHRMEHLGSYTYTQKDFRHAQQRTGHWDKRHVRAVAV